MRRCAQWAARITTPLRLSANEIAQWDSLCLRVPGLQSPFLTPHFACAVAKVKPHVRVCVVELGGKVAGFFPFQFASAPHRLLGIAESLAGYMAGYSGLVAEPGVTVSPDLLLRLCGVAFLRVCYMEESQRALALQAGIAERGLIIRLDHGSEAYWNELKQRDRHFVAETERRQRQLEKAHGPLKLVMIGPDQRPLELERLIRYKRQQYRKTGAFDVLSMNWKRDLLMHLAGSSEPTCSGVLSSLYAGETWVASQFSLRNQGVLNYYFPVYNPELPKYSPGRLLLKFMIDNCETLGLTTVDRCAGDTPAKRDFANDSHLLFSGYWHRPTPISLLYRASCSIMWRAGALNEKFT